MRHGARMTRLMGVCCRHTFGDSVICAMRTTRLADPRVSAAGASLVARWSGATAGKLAGGLSKQAESPPVVKTRCGEFFVRADVTGEFVFLVTKLSPYYDR